jgi:hypothetical protein
LHLYFIPYMSNQFTLDELELEYPIIYGVSTALRHIRLGFQIECHPDFLVEFYEDVEGYLDKSAHASFLITYLEDQTQFLVIRNKGTKSLFYPRYKKVDYLLCATGDEELNPEIIKLFAKLKGISLCFALDKPQQREILNFSQLQ